MSLRSGSLLWFFAFLFFMCSCTPRELNPADYVKWVESKDHGLVKEKKIGNMHFLAQYKPYEYVVLKEEGLAKVTRKAMTEQLNQMGDLIYFTLRMQSLDGSDPLKIGVNTKEEYYSRIKYLSFDVQRDLRLVLGGDTIKCVIANYDRSYSLKPEITLIAGFLYKKSKVTDDLEFIYTDKIFNSGPVMMNFSVSDIKKLPNLKL